MQDLNVLVNGQEEMVDKIEARVEASAAAAEKGVADLEKAQEYVTAYRCKGLVALLLVAATITVLLLLHFVGRRSDGAPII